MDTGQHPSQKTAFIIAHSRGLLAEFQAWAERDLREMQAMIERTQSAAKESHAAIARLEQLLASRSI